MKRYFMGLVIAAGMGAAAVAFASESSPGIADNDLAQCAVTCKSDSTGSCSGDCPTGKSCKRLHNMNCGCTK